MGVSSTDTAYVQRAGCMSKERNDERKEEYCFDLYAGVYGGDLSKYLILGFGNLVDPSDAAFAVTDTIFPSAYLQLPTQLPERNTSSNSALSYDLEETPSVIAETYPKTYPDIRISYDAAHERGRSGLSSPPPSSPSTHAYSASNTDRYQRSWARMRTDWGIVGWGRGAVGGSTEKRVIGHLEEAYQRVVLRHRARLGIGGIQIRAARQMAGCETYGVEIQEGPAESGKDQVAAGGSNARAWSFVASYVQRDLVDGTKEHVGSRTVSLHPFAPLDARSRVQTGSCLFDGLPPVSVCCSGHSTWTLYACMQAIATRRVDEVRTCKSSAVGLKNLASHAG
ncbi:hypothetical protein PENSPDRAFT_671170 [Peniophora sp. CONT]|nr:hypothetical protein PENSPDRAFT_671170 [Peniophora sp. CONT]